MEVQLRRCGAFFYLNFINLIKEVRILEINKIRYYDNYGNPILTADELLGRVAPVLSSHPFKMEPKATDLSPVKPLRRRGDEPKQAESERG